MDKSSRSVFRYTFLGVAALLLISVSISYSFVKSHLRDVLRYEVSEYRSEGDCLTSANLALKYDTGAYANRITDLPVSRCTRYAHTAHWTLPVPGKNLFINDRIFSEEDIFPEEICRGINGLSYVDLGILKQPFSGLKTQCFGGSIKSLVFAVNGEDGDASEVFAQAGYKPRPAGAVLPAPGDLGDTGWLIAPLN